MMVKREELAAKIFNLKAGIRDSKKFKEDLNTAGRALSQKIQELQTSISGVGVLLEKTYEAPSDGTQYSMANVREARDFLIELVETYLPQFDNQDEIKELEAIQNETGLNQSNTR